jgi:ribosomal protein S18 acetylase RimI-like enzyme
VTRRPEFALPSIRLVADGDGAVVGLIDIEIDDTNATIDCIGVHPDHQRNGWATLLLDGVLRRLPDTVRSLDAWTRETPSANAWYLAVGFEERYRYVHVYHEPDDPDDPINGFASPAGVSAPVRAFAHAPIEMEDQLRERFRRVYVCRRYVADL